MVSCENDMALVHVTPTIAGDRLEYWVVRVVGYSVTFTHGFSLVSEQRTDPCFLEVRVSNPVSL